MGHASLQAPDDELLELVGPLLELVAPLLALVVPLLDVVASLVELVVPVAVPVVALLPKVVVPDAVVVPLLELVMLPAIVVPLLELVVPAAVPVPVDEEPPLPAVFPALPPSQPTIAPTTIPTTVRFEAMLARICVSSAMTRGARDSTGEYASTSADSTATGQALTARPRTPARPLPFRHPPSPSSPLRGSQVAAVFLVRFPPVGAPARAD
jgi:hypothetical protein